MNAPLTPQQVLQNRLDLYLAAEARILRAQETQIGDGVTLRRHRNAELSEVRAQIEAITGQLALYGPRGVVYLR